MVAAARQEAHEESLRRLSPLLIPERKALLDSLLVLEAHGRRTPLGWLRRHATANSPRALLEVLDKLRRLQDCNVSDRDLTALNAAIDDLVDFQYAQPLAEIWGGGTLSSSDG